MKQTIDPDLIKHLEFRKLTKKEKLKYSKLGKEHTPIFKHELLDLFIYPKHTNEQVVRNFIESVIWRYDRDLELGRYLNKIYSF